MVRQSCLRLNRPRPGTLFLRYTTWRIQLLNQADAGRLGMVDFPQNPDHHLMVSINGVPVADQWFDGLVEQIVKVTIPGGVLA